MGNNPSTEKPTTEQAKSQPDEAKPQEAKEDISWLEEAIESSVRSAGVSEKLRVGNRTVTRL